MEPATGRKRVRKKAQGFLGIAVCELDNIECLANAFGTGSFLAARGWEGARSTGGHAEGAPNPCEERPCGCGWWTTKAPTAQEACTLCSGSWKRVREPVSGCSARLRFSRISPPPS